jgi:hypothetical protein
LSNSTIADAGAPAATRRSSIAKSIFIRSNPKFLSYFLGLCPMVREGSRPAPPYPQGMRPCRARRLAYACPTEPGWDIASARHLPLQASELACAYTLPGAAMCGR